MFLRAVQKAFLFMLSEILNKNGKIQSESKKVSSGNLFTLFPQYNKKGNKSRKNFVQIDWMVGDIEWLRFTYYSDVYKGNVKGLHRTQLILAMFTLLGLTFNHIQGVKNKDTQEILATSPKEAIKLLNTYYALDLDQKTLSNYFLLEPYLYEGLEREKYMNIMKIYLKILDRTRCDIPSNLQMCATSGGPSACNFISGYSNFSSLNKWV